MKAFEKNVLNLDNDTLYDYLIEGKQVQGQHNTKEMQTILQHVQYRKQNRESVDLPPSM
jgi:hypothetical protein